MKMVLESLARESDLLDAQRLVHLQSQDLTWLILRGKRESLTII